MVKKKFKASKKKKTKSKSTQSKKQKSSEKVFDFAKIEKKWQNKWEKEEVFEINKSSKKPKFYVLEMYPYPSGSGLHMGHAFNYTIGDIYARFKRMKGFNVLYPMGYDSFGLPAENAAIKAGEHPEKYTEKSIKNFIKQQKSLGLSYDWSKTLASHKPEFYKWDQLFFLKLFEKGLIYRKKAPVNFCGKCNTVLANEQVHNGKCWRHKDTEVEIKYLEQWFAKITDYSEELLDMIDNLEWPERIKTMQKNWIGKSHGTEIIFVINKKKWPVFTTRPDTIFGATFMVISANHPELMELVSEEQENKVKKFLKKNKTLSEKELKEREKEGVFTGSYAVNPINNEKIPVYAGNFVVSDYGSGMVMAVPAHDQRDFEFSEKYNIPIKVSVEPKDFEIYSRKGHLPRAYEGEGIIVNSDRFNGMESSKAKKEITKFLEKKGFAKKTIQYKLRDWLVSRQRYWGAPIPVVYCNKCGLVPVPEKKLPVLLPKKVKFGKGNPLLTSKKFLETKCPKCNGNAKRETDTMDTFFDSSWYYLRYCDNKNNKKPFEKSKIKYWMPINQYIGGAEHATMHLIYARFFTKALRDLGYLEFDEPFLRLFNQGMLHGEDRYVMSKSRGNVVLPEEVSKKYGIDTARLFLVSIASTNKDIEWSEEGIEGALRFIKKIMNYFEKQKFSKSNALIEHKVNKTIKEIEKDINGFNYNLAVIKLRELFSYIEEGNSSKKNAEIFLKLLHPFCPHLTEELWEKLGNKNFISLEKWPVVDEKKINKTLEKETENIEKLIKDINHVLKMIEQKPEKAFVYALPNEVDSYKDKIKFIEKKTKIKINVYAVNDPEVKSGKADPENKSKKAKPGKPGFYLE